MALERIKTTIPNERAKPAMPTGGIHAIPGRALAPAAVGQSTTLGSSTGQPEGVALGIDAKSVGRFTRPDDGALPTDTATFEGVRYPDDAHQAARSRRYKHQNAAAKLLPGSRTANCLWALTSIAEGVEVIHNEQEGRARFSGVQTCGSVWGCPCCSGAISDKRRDELNEAIAWARAEGLQVVMITLTGWHCQAEPLAEVYDDMKAAKKAWGQHRAMKAMRPKKGEAATDERCIVGTVTATELTHGGNGWHPHFHLLVFVKATTQADAIAKMERLRAPWLASLEGRGRHGSGAAFRVDGASKAGDYVAKWGAAEEITLSNKKKGKTRTKDGKAFKGRTPFGLLADYAEQSDKQAGALFVEYFETVFGSRQLMWSPGLKERAGVGNVSDEQAAEEQAARAEQDKADQVLDEFTPNEWREVRHARAAILKFAEIFGRDGVRAVVQQARAQWASAPAAAKRVWNWEARADEAQRKRKSTRAALKVRRAAIDAEQKAKRKGKP